MAPIRSFWLNLKKQLRFIYYNISFLFEDWSMRRVNRTELLNHSGKVILITGGTRGLGVHVIRMLLQCDFKVVIGCRNVDAASKLLEEARKAGINSGELIGFQLDVSSLDSVRKFAKIVKENHPKIHILLNNAGVLNAPYKLTEDGFESIFATNYLGHFLLTHLLLPELNAACEEGYSARIVNVSSCAHFRGNINFEDINYSKHFNYPEVYSQSKLAQILFTKYLSKLLKEFGYTINIFAVHPGTCQTEIFDGTLMKRLGFHFFFKTPKQGAIPIVHTCMTPYLNERSGVYISNCRIRPSSKESEDEDMQERLFKLSMIFTKIENFFSTLKL